MPGEMLKHITKQIYDLMALKMNEFIRMTEPQGCDPRNDPNNVHVKGADEMDHILYNNSLNDLMQRIKVNDMNRSKFFNLTIDFMKQQAGWKTIDVLQIKSSYEHSSLQEHEFNSYLKVMKKSTLSAVVKNNIKNLFFEFD